MSTTPYFHDNVLTKRPYLTEAMCRRVVAAPVRKETQPDGRIRHWVFDASLNKWLRVVTLADGTTLHNAFPDRGFSP
jgi:hypothetical protein